MRTIEFRIDIKDNNRQIKSFLYDFGVSQSLLIKLKKQVDGILLNGVPARTIDHLKTGDTLQIKIPNTGSAATPSNEKLDVIYEDEDLVAVNKPAYMPVHESRNHRGDALSNAFAAYCHDDISFSAIYRLDKDTSGIILIAKNSLAAAKLAGKVKKDYYALVEGTISEDGVIDLPIKRVNDSIIKRCVAADGERAVTNYKVVSIRDGYTILKINLETGKTHQIRVHFSSIGHPLLGDDLYGGDMRNIKRQALHCKDIYFTHPVTGEKEHISCSFPNDFKGLI